MEIAFGLRMGVCAYFSSRTPSGVDPVRAAAASGVGGSSSLCLLSACGSLYLGVFALLHEEASLMIAKQGTESTSIAASSHFIASFI